MSSVDDILLSSGLSEEMFRRWEKDPMSVDPTWRKAFEKIESAPKPKKPGTTPTLHPPTKKLEGEEFRDEVLKLRMKELIDHYRKEGHKNADINPFNEPVKKDYSDFSKQELKAFFPTLGILKMKEAPLEEILDQLERLYSGKLGFQFSSIVSEEEEKWLAKEIEEGFFLIETPIEEKQMILEELSKADLFETFMHTKYTGQKRFSIEGAESLIPMLEQVILSGTSAGVSAFVIGMAHRGRLNVLSNILDKSYQEIFSEFDEGYVPEAFHGTGDVKYHKGYTSKREIGDKKTVEIMLPPNPSHLESIDSVVEGIVKGKQVKIEEDPKDSAMAILVHGDAAIAGQGIVYETLQMQSLPGYQTGGTIHFVVNNQIGFTTSPDEGRSTVYCTDIAKSFGNPVIHVNASDPEVCVKAAKLAVKYRMRFKKDIFIDMYCWRKYGHNEGDEPAFTHPKLYRHIKSMKPVRETYRDLLISEGSVEKEIAEEMEKTFKRALSEAKEGLKLGDPKKEKRRKTHGPYTPPDVETAVDKKTLEKIGLKMVDIPEGFNLHPKVLHLAEERVEMATGKKPLNWGMAEILAYGSLVLEGHEVRVSGQDVERGTFSHRHALYVDQESSQKYVPLAHLEKGQAKFSIYNSILSEYAVLGFEYGYSLTTPNGLTIWEAQFGDFANGAQVIFDQYLAPAEAKWGQKSNLTVFLPHGYEGQGPEHSSGRIERYLILAGERNLRVCVPSLPAQQFHLLRRQALDPEQKPLIAFTPKALLRLPAASSPLSDFTEGRFHEILDDPDRPENPKKVVFCTGKIFYELQAEREKLKDDRVALIRIEQLYPLYKEELKKIFKPYEKVETVLWVQEEPENMGALHYIVPRLEKLLERKVKAIARPVSATTASGIYAFHKIESKDIMEEVFKEKPDSYDIAGQMRA